RKSFFAADEEQDPEAMEEVTAVKTLGGVVDWIVGTIEQAAGRAAPARAAGDPSRDDAAAAVTAEAAAEPDESSSLALPRIVFAPVDAPLVHPSEPTFDESRVVLVTDDGYGIAGALSARIRDRGGRIALLRAGRTARSVGDGVYESDLSDPESVEAVVSMIREGEGPIGGLIHLRPLRARAASRSDEDVRSGLADWKARLSSEVRSLFLLARSVSVDLQRPGAQPAFVLSTSVMGGAFGIAMPGGEETGPFFAGHGALAGLVKSMALEWPSVRCKAVDFDAGSTPEEITTGLVHELAAADPHVQVGYRRTRRLTLESRSAELAERAAASPHADERSVLLLTGGARGITAEVAIDIAERYRPTLVLVGRSALPDGPESPDTAALESAREIKQVLIAQLRERDEQVTVAKVEALSQRLLKDREIRENLERMRRAGARVHYEQVDVCDEEKMRALVEQIRRDHGRLDGVIHGAGLIEDKLIEDKTPDSFDRVFDTKADSTFILSRVLSPETLRFLVLFSSAAAAFGNRGQSDYAAANEVLNKLAIDLDSRWNGRVVSIGWGPWAKTGMVSTELQRQFAERGIQLIGVAEGCNALDRELRLGRKGEAAVVLAGGAWGTKPSGGATAGGAAEVDEAVGPLPMMNGASHERHGNTVELARRMDAERDLCLLDHRLDGTPVVPMALATELIAEAVQQGWPDLRVSGIRDLRLLNGIVLDGGPKDVRVTARTLSEPPHDRIGVDVDVEVTGLDDGLKHYRATVELSDKLPDPPGFDPVPAASLAPFPMTVSQAYERWLFHGPLFHGIVSVEGIGQNHVLSRLKTSDPESCIAGAGPGRWLIDPVVLDSGLQLIILWCRHHFDMTPLPSRFRHYRRYGSPEPGPVTCHMEASASLKGHSILTSLRFVDAAGRLFGVLEDLETTSSRELNRLAASRNA
ncbi:MAG: SDR family oxidoreductase, partial [Acidobacteriota bacterium]|nr:SDR family oxidoreductase [Acidobacteriota bacterium]